MFCFTWPTLWPFGCDFQSHAKCTYTYTLYTQYISIYNEANWPIGQFCLTSLSFWSFLCSLSSFRSRLAFVALALKNMFELLFEHNITVDVCHQIFSHFNLLSLRIGEHHRSRSQHCTRALVVYGYGDVKKSILDGFFFAKHILHVSTVSAFAAHELMIMNISCRFTLCFYLFFFLSFFPFCILTVQFVRRKYERKEKKNWIKLMFIHQPCSSSCIPTWYVCINGERNHNHINIIVSYEMSVMVA